MHEFAMAQGIFNTVYDTAIANDANEVTEIVIEIGRLAMLNPEQLKFMLGVMLSALARGLAAASQFASLTQPDRFATGASRSAWLATNREPRLRGGYATLR